MEETFEFIPSNVCSRKLTIHVDGDILLGIESYGGCHGNLQAVSALIKGMKIEEAISRLEGIKCRGSRTQQTSCADQLSKGLRKILQERGQ